MRQQPAHLPIAEEAMGPFLSRKGRGAFLGLVAPLVSALAIWLARIE
jgi:hypothetical protein